MSSSSLSDISPDLAQLNKGKKTKYNHLTNDFLYPDNHDEEEEKKKAYFAHAQDFVYPTDNDWKHVDHNDVEYYLKRHYSPVGLERLKEYEKRLSDIGWSDKGEDWDEGYIPEGEEEWLANYPEVGPDGKTAWEQDPYDKNLRRMKNLNDEVRRATLASAQSFRQWKLNRPPKKEYYERAAEIKREGIGEVQVVPQKTDKLYSLKVTFPEGFRHLSSEHGQNEKAKTNSGYHISLMYEPYKGHKIDKVAVGLRNKIGKYFGSWDSPEPQPMRFDKIRVSKGSTYELYDDTEFVNLLNELSKRGTDKWAHISLD
jgi:hypothetical protein